MSNSIQDSLEISPPNKLSNRAVYVSPNKLSTFRLMHDPYLDAPGKWFDSSAGVTQEGNEVMYLIRGTETYGQMVKDIRATGRGGFLYLLAWFFNLGDAEPSAKPPLPVLTMVPGDPTSQPRLVFQDAAQRGVEVRAMLWSQRHNRFTTMGSEYPGKIINAMPNARCIVDDKTAILFEIDAGIMAVGLKPRYFIQRVGSHHQKVVIVDGPAGLTAYCGGLDINRDRMDSDGGGFAISSGFHDVHVRIHGPAAYDLLRLFRDRWKDYLQGEDPEMDHDSVQPASKHWYGYQRDPRDLLSGDTTPRPQAFDALPHRQIVQIGRTFHSGLYGLMDPPGNPAHPPGEKNIRKMIFKGIETAERFIYIEDQYLYNAEITPELQKAIAKPGFRFLIILIAWDNMVEGEVYMQASLRRSRVLSPLLNGPNGRKVHVFCHNRLVHSKLYIFDDQYAVLGSANCNRRGLSHDSEVDAGIFDRSSNQQAAMHFARRLRMRLWATHLNLKKQATDPNVPVNDDDEYSELADAVASVAHWTKDWKDGVRLNPYTVMPEAQAYAKAQAALVQAEDDFKNGLRDWAKSKAGLLGGGTGFGAQLITDYIAGRTNLRLLTVDTLWDMILDPSDG